MTGLALWRYRNPPLNTNEARRRDRAEGESVGQPSMPPRNPINKCMDNRSMRKFMDVASVLTEIEVTRTISGNPNIRDICNGSVVAGTVGSHSVEHLSVGDGSQEVYLVRDNQHDVASYAIIEDNGQAWWLLEIYTRSSNRRQGLAAAIVKQIVEDKTRIFVDREMSIDGIQAVEGMISKSWVNASVADFDQNTLVAYDPAKDADKPMYDVVVPGTKRTHVLPLRKAQNVTWLLETRKRRGGVLQEHVRYVNAGRPPDRSGR